MVVDNCINLIIFSCIKIRPQSQIIPNPQNFSNIDRLNRRSDILNTLFPEPVMLVVWELVEWRTEVYLIVLVLMLQDHEFDALGYGQHG